MNPIHAFRQSLIENGEEPVNDSAYMESHRHGSEFTITKYRIRKSLAKLAQLWPVLSPEHYTIAYVWDLDDIAMLSRKHMMEVSLMRPDIDSMSLHRLVEKVLMSANIEHADEKATQSVMNILDVFDRRNRYSESTVLKYHALKCLYDDVRAKEKTSIISRELLEACGIVEEEEQDQLCQTAIECQKVYHQRWETVQKSLDMVNSRSDESRNKKYTNVVISNEGVGHTLSQLLLSAHASAFPIENVYSTGSSKEAVWRRIQRRFGANCLLVYVTSSNDYCFPKELERNRSIRVWKIKSKASIKELHNWQEDQFLTF